MNSKFIKGLYIFFAITAVALLAVQFKRAMVVVKPDETITPTPVSSPANTTPMATPNLYPTISDDIKDKDLRWIPVEVNFGPDYNKNTTKPTIQDMVVGKQETNGREYEIKIKPYPAISQEAIKNISDSFEKARQINYLYYKKNYPYSDNGGKLISTHQEDYLLDVKKYNYLHIDNINYVKHENITKISLAHNKHDYNYTNKEGTFKLSSMGDYPEYAKKQFIDQNGFHNIEQEFWRYLDPVAIASLDKTDAKELTNHNPLVIAMGAFYNKNYNLNGEIYTQYTFKYDIKDPVLPFLELPKTISIMLNSNNEIVEIFMNGRRYYDFSFNKDLLNILLKEKNIDIYNLEANKADNFCYEPCF